MPTIENYGTISQQPIVVDGVTRTLRDWADFHQLPYKTVAMRWKRGHREPKKLFFKAGHTQDSTGVWVYNDKPSKA